MESMFFGGILMKIEKLEIKGFGKFKDYKLSFSDGINVIYGKNEAGKSTIQNFVKAMFYGLKNKRNSEVITQVKRYKPWDNSQYRGIIEYDLSNGEHYRIERDFDSGKVNIYNDSYN